MTPATETRRSATLLIGHVLDRLREIPDNAIQCVVTSPPYWGLRDYGIEPSVWDAEPGCAHRWDSETVEREMRRGLGLAQSAANTRGGGLKAAEVPNQKFTSSFCRVCPAWRGCLGLEPTPSSSAPATGFSTNTGAPFPTLRLRVRASSKGTYEPACRY